MINEQELAETIETISEGGQALGVSCEDVYRAMLKDDVFTIRMMEGIHTCNSFVGFRRKFMEVSESLLIEALRAKQEVNNGLL
jgi:hypothetical protein